MARIDSTDSTHPPDSSRSPDGGSFDHDRGRIWLDPDLAEGLSGSERQRLEAHLAECDECREERRSLGALDALLAAGRVPVDEGFHARVMGSLPTAGWEVRTAAAWRWPLAALAALVATVGALLGATSSQLAADGSFLGAGAALVDLLVTGTLAGAGLLGASWKGAGLVTLEALGRVPGGLLAFTVLVICLNLLLLGLLRRRPAPAEGESRR